MASPVFSDSHFDDWKTGLSVEARGGMYNQIGGALRFGSDFPELIDMLELRVNQADTGNTSQFESSSIISLSIGGSDEKSGLRYGLDFYHRDVEIVTTSFADSYQQYGVKTHADLRILEFHPSWHDESVNVFVGGVFNSRQIDGRLPAFDGELSTLLTGKLMVQIVEILGLEELNFTLEISETDPVNLYSGIQLMEVCDIGFHSPLVAEVDGRKQFAYQFVIAGHLGMMKDSCDESMIFGSGINIGWTW